MSPLWHVASCLTACHYTAPATAPLSSCHPPELTVFDSGNLNVQQGSSCSEATMQRGSEAARQHHEVAIAFDWQRHSGQREIFI